MFDFEEDVDKLETGVDEESVDKIAFEEIGEPAKGMRRIVLGTSCVATKALPLPRQAQRG